MNIGFREITLDTGDTFPVSDGLTVIVGGNNVGKTKLLRDLSRIGRQPVTRSSLVRMVSPRYRGTANEAVNWLERNVRTVEDDHSRRFSFDFNVDLLESTVRAGWGREDFWVIDPRPFVRLLSVDDRLGQLDDTESVDPFKLNDLRLNLNDLQRLWLNPSKVAELSELVQQAFTKPVSVPSDLGPLVAIFWGSITSSLFRDPNAHAEQLRSVPRVNSQGHGLRAYVSLLMSIVIAEAKVLLIDEPEAFLHPPHARQLGSVLEAVRQRGTQVIIATHSPDMLQGLVSASGTVGELSIVRLTRQENSTHAAPISVDSVRRMALNPLLRQSSILDGLFYRSAVVCESGGDCAYYAAVLEFLVEQGRIDRWLADIHFTHCSGADRIPVAARALTEAHVPVASIVDMDVLQDKSKLDRLIAAHGGLPTDVDLTNDLRALRNTVTGSIRQVLRRDARARILEILDADDGEALSRDEVDRVRGQLTTYGGWKEVKKRGVRSFDGATYRSLATVLSTLAKIGVFVVPVGELESFHPELDRSDKQRWLASVLEERRYTANGEQLGFVESVVKFLSSADDPKVPT